MAISLIGTRDTVFYHTANNQTAILEEGETIDTDGNYAIDTSSYTGTTTIVEGTSSGFYSGYWDHYVENSTLIVEETGELLGSDAGAYVGGDSTVVWNAGHIEGEGNYGLYVSGSGGEVTVFNSGTLKGGTYGVYQFGGSFNLKNIGKIKGDDYGVRTSASSEDQGTFIENKDIIKGDIYGIWYSSTASSDHLMNSGKIKSDGDIAIYGNDAVQQIFNKGDIEGDVYLLGGDDVFLGRKGGEVDGKVYAGAGEDYLKGREDNDQFKGDGGDDVLKGRDGEDRLWGGDNNDFLNGGKDDDRLKGDSGNDTLIGGKGNDKFWGGTGADFFVMKGRTDKDIIYDFEQGTDRIDLSAYGIVSAGQFEDDAIKYKNGDGYIDMDEIGGDGTLIVRDVDNFNFSDFIFV